MQSVLLSCKLSKFLDGPSPCSAFSFFAKTSWSLFGIPANWSKALRRSLLYENSLHVPQARLCVRALWISVHLSRPAVWVKMPPSPGRKLSPREGRVWLRPQSRRATERAQSRDRRAPRRPHQDSALPSTSVPTPPVQAPNEEAPWTRDKDFQVGWVPGPGAPGCPRSGA